MPDSYWTPEYQKDLDAENRRSGYEWEQLLKRPDWQEDVFEIHAINARQCNRIKARQLKHLKLQGLLEEHEKSKAIADEWGDRTLSYAQQCLKAWEKLKREKRDAKAP